MSGNDTSPPPALQVLEADQLNLVAGGVTEGPDGKGCTEPRHIVIRSH